MRVKLESHLPQALPPGSKTAIFCFGHCFDRHQRVCQLELLVDSAAYTPTAMGMPRRDLLEWLRRIGEDPEGRSYRSGFWATLPVHAPATPGSVELQAAVRLADGTRSVHALGSIPVREPDAVVAPLQPPESTIAVCLATFDPDPALLRAQLESLRAQVGESWVCVISDGGSSDERFAAVIDATQGDARFFISRAEHRLDPYRNFERALQMVPGTVEVVALCDQDDRWYPEKLAVLRQALGSAELVYSDQRLVAADGRVLRDSLWLGRRNDVGNLASMLVAGTVPGAAMLFRRELLESALPFPDTPGVQYHDHWLSLVALCRGELAYVDRPLFDWVQHRAAVSGGARHSVLERGSRGWRAAYFGGFVPREMLARTLLLRLGDQLPVRKRRALEWFAAAERSPPAFAWLALRPLRRLLGRDETLGGESALTRGVLWRWLLSLAVGRAETPGRRPYDASFPDPPRFEQRRLRRWRVGV